MLVAWQKNGAGLDATLAERWADGMLAVARWRKEITA
jgi:hypothetical protein